MTDELTMIICEKGAKGDIFTDDVTAECSLCHEVIHHRPYVSPDITKVCLDCGMDVMKKNDIEITVLPEQIREALEALKETEKGD